MPSIHLRGCALAHTTAIPVLTGVDLDVDHDPPAHGSGWVGVVGANGAGKSTLLRLVAGRLSPTAGSCTVQSERPPVLVEQEGPVLTDEVRAFGWDWSGPAARLRRRLDLDPDDLDRATGRGWDALSPGQRTRWRIAAALAVEPDVLLLDEPTNHLDAAGRAVLVEALHELRGLGLVVSHDRDLLEELTTRTLRVVDHGVQLHSGAYGEAADRWRAAEQHAAEERDRAQQAVRRERRQLADLRRARHGAEASAARRRREADPRDSDAREVGRKVAAASAEQAIARRVAAQHSRLARAAATVDGLPVTRDHRDAVGFHHEPGRGSLLSLRGDVAHAGGEVLLRDVHVALGDGDRVHVAGCNGAGKTTLLNALLAQAPAEGVARLPQRATADLGWLDRLEPQLRGRVLGTAARLGVVPGRVLGARATSPGERRKLAIARLLAGDARLLVLDEPTNHLDLPAIEALQDALAAWPGALLLVTHDQRLAAATTDHRWEVADGRVRVDPLTGPVVSGS